MKKLQTLILLLCLCVSNPVWSRDSIELVVPLTPGGAVDMTARALSKALTNENIDNVIGYYPGAGGDIALSRVLKNPNNSVFIASSANFVFSNVVFDRDNVYTKDLIIVGPSVTNAMAFYAPLGKDIKNFKELISTAQQNDTPCATSNSHGEIALKQINKQYGTKFTPVPYKGTGQLIPDLIGGHVNCAYDQIAPYVAYQDKVIMLATSSDKPYKEDIPLMSSILPNYYFVTWYAVGIPKNSTLLKDKKFIEIVKTWNQNKEIVGPLIEKSFVAAKFDPNLNEKAEKATIYYKNVLK